MLVSSYASTWIYTECSITAAMMATYFVLAVIGDVESALLCIPEDRCMLLAHCVLVRKVEVVQVSCALLPSDIDFKTASLFYVELSSVLSN